MLRGFHFGPVYLYEAGAWQAPAEDLPAESIDAEVERFERAVARSERELGKIVTVAQEKLGDGSARIFDAHAPHAAATAMESIESPTASRTRAPNDTPECAAGAQRWQA